MRKLNRIGKTAEDYQVHRHNHVWSWGGTLPDDSIVLFMWYHEAKVVANLVWVEAHNPEDTGNGGSERLAHLKEIKAGTPGYALLGFRKIDAEGKWSWHGLEGTPLHPIMSVLEPDKDGRIWVVLRDH